VPAAVALLNTFVDFYLKLFHMKKGPYYFVLFGATSVADPECLFRIPGPNFSIPDPGSRVENLPCPGSATKNLSI
jgi:hypothetical protein